jgi:hypothetical protein
MAIDHRELYVAHTRQETEGLLRRIARELAVQDWLVLGYLLALNIVALGAASHPAKLVAVERMSALLVFLVVTLIVVRGGVLKHPFWTPSTGSRSRHRSRAASRQPAAREHD